jgi:hypothetical protein
VTFAQQLLNLGARFVHFLQCDREAVRRRHELRIQRWLTYVCPTCHGEFLDWADMSRHECQGKGKAA